MTTSLTNISDLTGRPEAIALSTTRLGDGSLLYLLTVVPETEARAYEQVFRRVRESVQISDEVSRK